MSEQLVSEVLPASSLQDEITEEMYSLFSSYYCDIKWSNFRKDVLSKDWVILFRDIQNKRVQGFTSLRIFDHRHLSKSMTIIYSGDTIIHQPYWNSMVLAKSWIRAVLNLTHDKQHPLYWLLISSGFRTYRYLPVFFRHFFPCYNQPTSSDTLSLMHDIATHLFGDQFDPASGIVRFREGATPLKDEYCPAPGMRSQDPHIRFFEEQNPNFRDGDELVCLTNVSVNNLTAAGERMAR